MLSPRSLKVPHGSVKTITSPRHQNEIEVIACKLFSYCQPD